MLVSPISFSSPPFHPTSACLLLMASQPSEQPGLFQPGSVYIKNFIKKRGKQGKLSTEDRGHDLHKMRLTAEHFIYCRSLPCPLTSLNRPLTGSYGAVH